MWGRRKSTSRPALTSGGKMDNHTWEGGLPAVVTVSHSHSGAMHLSASTNGSSYSPVQGVSGIPKTQGHETQYTAGGCLPACGRMVLASPFNTKCFQIRGVSTSLRTIVHVSSY